MAGFSVGDVQDPLKQAQNQGTWNHSITHLKTLLPMIYVPYHMVTVIQGIHILYFYSLEFS